jgi:hypothetical protein
LLGYMTLWGGVSVIVGALGYIGKKVIDIMADIMKSRILMAKPKEHVELYGPDGKVIKLVEVAPRLREGK